MVRSKLFRLSGKKKAIIPIVIILMLIMVAYFVPISDFFSVTQQEVESYIDSKNDLSPYELDLLSEILLPGGIYEDPSIMDDGYVDSDYPNNNYNDNYLCGDESKDMYVKINFVGLYHFITENGYTFDEVVNHIDLKLRSYTSTTTRSFYFHSCSDSWNEESLTWNNQPTGDYYQGYQSVQSDGSYYVYQITDIVKNNFENGDWICSIQMLYASGLFDVTFSSKEYTHPPLVYIDSKMEINSVPWVLTGIPVSGGFSTYLGIDSGYRIKKNTAVLDVNVPPVIYEGESFTVEVATGYFTDSVVKIELLDPSDTVVGTYTGSVPEVIVSNCPLPQGDGTVRVTASRAGESLVATKPVTVAGLDLIVEQDPYYEAGETFWVDVHFSDPTINRPVTIEFYQGSLLVASYAGTMPSVQILNPIMTGTVDMVVTTTYSGITYEKTLTISFDEIQLVVVHPGTFQYGLTTQIQVSISNHPEVSNPVQVTFSKGTSILEQYNGNMPLIQIDSPKVLGVAQMKVATSYMGTSYVRVFDVFFEGYPIVTTARANSYVQYEHEPVIFFVDVRDINGEYLTPKYIADIIPICTLSGGEVTESSYEHLGDGTYKISSTVVGVGNFIGKLAFKYLGTAFESELISINIEENALAISTAGIPSSAIRYEYFTGEVEIFDPKGVKIDPDNLEIDVHLPDGSTIDYIPMSQMNRMSAGKYSFSYRPTQLERYTFEVTATKTDVTTATSKATVNVYDDSDIEPDDDIVSMILGVIIKYIWVFVIIFIGVIILIWKFLR